MNDLSPSLCRRRFDFDAWYAHCSAIIRAELARRGISVRALLSAGVLKSRNGFTERLKSASLRPKEISDLADHLNLELPHLMTAFIASQPDESYTNSFFENISLLYRALILECDSMGLDFLPDMERLRPAVARYLASRVIAILTAHHDRCEQARDDLILV
jgi:hypothetical protein